jgi:hypothetical protein
MVFGVVGELVADAQRHAARLALQLRHPGESKVNTGEGQKCVKETRRLDR